MTEELCCRCDEPTGRAGRGEDSLYVTEEWGPLCEDCWADTWRAWPYEECPACGGDVEIATDAQEGMAGEDDPVRCADCGLLGSIGVEDFGEETATAYVRWEEF